MGDHDDDKGSGVNQKVVISAIFSLLIMMLIIILLHLYSRYLQRRQERRRSSAALQRLSRQIAHDQLDNFSSEQPKVGLDPSVVATIPAFKYSQKDRLDDADQNMDCSVCLSTVVEDAMVRVLPNCKHMFHVECIDMWLASHDTCPICRTLAEPSRATQPEEGVLVRQPPSAPPIQEGNSSRNGPEMEKGRESSGSRFGSLRWMVGRDRSSRARSSGDEISVQDLERQ